MKNNQSQGFVLPMILAVVIVAMILLPGLVSWVQQDSKQSVRESKRTLAYNLAEAAVERGMWKLKSSTTTFNQARTGITISSYTFSTKYGDIQNGYYRIRFASGPTSREVTIYGEGRDLQANETRAIKAVFKNLTIPGAVLSGGNVSLGDAMQIHWGPIMAQGNIVLTHTFSASAYYPRKFSKQAVSSTVVGYPRDTNGVNPPNTDNLEWWSSYNVPELPILDFATMRSSAQADGTYNIFGCRSNAATPNNWNGSAWTYNCNGSAPHTNHFQNPDRHPKSKLKKIWFWDGNVQITGTSAAEGSGIYGAVIVIGNMTNYAGDNLSVSNARVSSTAWEEYQKIDTASSNQYPGDTGYHSNSTTFNLGSQSWTGGPSTSNTDVGYRGLIYVTGNLTFQGLSDIYGAVWVGGSVSRNGTLADPVLLFFDDSLELPTLNVVLTRTSWDETIPSSTAWP